MLFGELDLHLHAYQFLHAAFIFFVFCQMLYFLPLIAQMTCQDSGINASYEQVPWLEYGAWGSAADSSPHS